MNEVGNKPPKPYQAKNVTNEKEAQSEQNSVIRVITSPKQPTKASSVDSH